MADLVAASYLACSLAFCALTVLLAVAHERRSRATSLLWASAITAVWAVCLAFDARDRFLDPSSLLLVELVRGAAWVFVVGGLAPKSGTVSAITRLAYGSAAAMTIVSYAFHFIAGAGAEIVHALLPLATAGNGVVVLLLLEQSYRNSTEAGRWALRPLFIGAGGMFAFDVYLGAQALLLHGFGSASWLARGLIGALCVPPIALAARRNPLWSLRIFVSRQVVFYSTTLVAVGVYLMAMSGVAYLIQRRGGDWGPAAQVAFFIGAALFLAFLVGSEALRRRLRVLISKHFYRNKYDYRDEWLRFVSTLASGSAEASLQPTLIRAVAQIIGSPSGVLWLHTPHDRHFVATCIWGEGSLRDHPLPNLGADSELIASLEERCWIIDLADYRRSATAQEKIIVPDSLIAEGGLRLLVPLLHGPRLVGVLGLGPPREPFDLSYEDLDLLKTVGRQVAMHVVQFEAEQRLAESRQFEALHRLTAFTAHDLKNLAAKLSLIVVNAEKHKRNPDFVDDAIDTVRLAADRATRLIAQLQGGEHPQAVQACCDIRAILAKVVARCASEDPTPDLQDATGGGPTLVRGDPDRLASTFEHAVRNAQQATASVGKVTVHLSEMSEEVIVKIVDNGSGMTAEFLRDRLFRPFDTTKGSKGMGIGAYQVRDYVRSLGGEVHVTSEPSVGTVFALHLPAVQASGDVPR